MKGSAEQAPDFRVGFLNVDLEIESSASLAPLVAEWGERVFVLYHGPGALAGGPAPGSSRHLLTLEVAGKSCGVDATIRALCALVEKLSPANRRRWDRARKHFDVGYSLPTTDPSLRFVLRADSLARLTKLGAALSVTVYDFTRMSTTGNATASGG